MPKRETYFSGATIAACAAAMSAELTASFSRPRPPVERPPALLLLDLQGYFLNPRSPALIPSAEAILPCLMPLATLFARRRWPLLITRHLNNADNAGQMGRWWRRLIEAGDPLSQLIPELRPLTGAATVLEKTQYDAFHETGLEAWLRQRQVEQLIIGGVAAELCCETTARSAFVRGFDVFFLIDGTASIQERFHRATLLNLARGFAHPLLCEEMLAALPAPEEKR